jgi:YbbR domain-containing protein
VAVEFEESSAKIVPVVPAVEGDPADGYVVGTIAASPATVQVVGPVSALTNLTEAITEPVTVAGASAPVRETVTIGVPDPALRLSTPQSAVVTVDVAAAPVDRRVGDIPVQGKGGSARRPQISPGTVAVVLRGAREMLDSMAPSVLEASVDLEGLGQGQYQLPVRVVPPQHITVVRVEPAQVRVRIP